jgi:hypothetical protein
VSFDIHLQGFRDGDDADADAAVVLEALRPFVRNGPERMGLDEFAELVTADGGAELYIGEPARGFMVAHASGREIWRVLYEVAARASLAVLFPGARVACVTSSDLLPHLPAEIRDDARVVRSGDELRAAVESS